MRRKTHASFEALPPSDDPVDRITDDIRVRLDLRACWFEAFPFDSLLPRIERDGIVLPADEPGTRSYSQWCPPDGVELPVRYGALTLGRFVLVPRVLTCGVLMTPGQRELARTLAQLAGDELGRRWTVPTESRASAEKEDHRD
jgi:hypothetical protein